MAKIEHAKLKSFTGCERPPRELRPPLRAGNAYCSPDELKHEAAA
jgi:hypothetical protein